MKMITLLLGVLFSASAFAGFGGYNGTTNLGVFQDMKCSSGLVCTKQGGKLQVTTTTQSGVSVVAAVTGTLTIAQCGTTFYNTAAAVMTLPLASTALGCSFNFVVLNGSNFDINPNDADRILTLTDATGDATRNATIGSTVSLKAVSSTQWVVQAINGTWTDVN